MPPTTAGDEANVPLLRVVPTSEELETTFWTRYGDFDSLNWGPRMRRRFGYYTPDEVYETIVAKLVGKGACWADVGCGRDIFPGNERLARELADRSGSLVGIDPSNNIDENELVHRRLKSTIEECDLEEEFDVITLRMVAEHITDPQAVVANLNRMTKPGGSVVVYTPNRWSPLSVLAALIPHAFHHSIKRLLWQTEEQDTFPVAYELNTRGQLAHHFCAHGFRESYFARVDDCRTFWRFRLLSYLELASRKCFNAVGLHYPENCLIGVYQKVSDPTPSAT